MNIIEQNQAILKQLLIEAYQDALDEIGCEPNSLNQAVVSEDAYPILTQGVINHVGEFVLSFLRVGPDDITSIVDFCFQSVRLLTEKRFVIEGLADISIFGKGKKYLIDYRFDNQNFSEAVCCKNGTVRDMRNLELVYAGDIGTRNIQTVRKLINYLTKCLYSTSID